MIVVIEMAQYHVGVHGCAPLHVGFTKCAMNNATTNPKPSGKIFR